MIAATQRTFHRDGSQPTHGQYFVFGSNLSGLHAGGAAKAASMYYGAVWGIAEGITGQSYAIPTVKAQIAGPLPLADIEAAVKRFLHHAATHPEDQFFVTRIGCVLAGYDDSQIAPMFASAPFNCSLPDTWAELVGGDA